MDIWGDLENAKWRLIAAVDRLASQGDLTMPEAEQLFELLDVIDDISLDELKARLHEILGWQGSKDQG